MGIDHHVQSDPSGSRMALDSPAFCGCLGPPCIYFICIPHLKDEFSMGDICGTSRRKNLNETAIDTWPPKGPSISDKARPRGLCKPAA